MVLDMKGFPGDLNINILDFDQYDLEIVSGEVQKSLSNFSEIEEKTLLICYLMEVCLQMLKCNGDFPSHYQY